MTRRINRFPVRRLADGRAMINLGSSTRTAPNWNSIDFSWIITLGRHKRLTDLLHRSGLLSQPRYDRMIAMDPAVIRWDLRKGIPFADRTFDVVYHSHVLEHVDRDTAPIFLGECMRTLKEGGVIRIAVPDLELLSRLYLESLARIPNGGSSDEHARAAEAIFDQMIVRTPKVRREQKPIVRFAEALLIGNTDRAGVLHRWMYDRVSLAELLRSVGFVDVQRHTATSSSVSDWARFNLDTNPDGSIYKPDSFYMEARRP